MCQSVLSTLTGFVDWVNISHITDDNGRLLQLLCEMLSDGNLQLHAAECLLLIVSRKVEEVFFFRRIKAAVTDHVFIMTVR